MVSDPSGIKFWVSPLITHPGSIEMLAEGKENLKQVVNKVCDEYELWPQHQRVQFVLQTFPCKACLIEILSVYQPEEAITGWSET